VPREKNAAIVKISLLRLALASIVLARKASIARRQGLKPAKRPAAKTVDADDMVRSLRAFPAAHAGELSLAEACNKIITNATVSKIAVMQYRTACILVVFLDGYIFKEDSKEETGPQFGIKCCFFLGRMHTLVIERPLV
jgi:hypothetical protein